MIAGESGRKWIERNTPMRRPGEVNELDGAMLLLASTQEAISQEKLSQLTVGG